MVPLSEQDPELWRRDLVKEGRDYLRRACAGPPLSHRVLQAAIHGAWCERKSLAEPPPWGIVLALYDRLLKARDDPIVRLNRAVALAEVDGPEAGLAELENFDAPAFASFLPYHAVRADLLRRAGRHAEAAAAYDAALGLDPPTAEAAWLRAQRAALLPLRG
jgi:RNA polymerase sigma-70 factor (ECF subfamily)